MIVHRRLLVRAIVNIDYLYRCIFEGQFIVLRLDFGGILSQSATQSKTSEYCGPEWFGKHGDPPDTSLPVCMRKLAQRYSRAEAVSRKETDSVPNWLAEESCRFDQRMIAPTPKEPMRMKPLAGDFQPGSGHGKVKWMDY
jgi:hypothetical protein